MKRKILIIILILELNLLVFGIFLTIQLQPTPIIASPNLSNEQIRCFNSIWEAYLGNSKTASEVKTLIAAIIANNTAETRSGTNRILTVNNKTLNPNEKENYSNYYDNTYTYTITADYDNDTGIVTNLNVSFNNKNDNIKNTTNENYSFNAYDDE